MRRVAGTTITALEIAGAVCGVPYVGAAAVLLQEIVRLCDDVGIRKVGMSLNPLTLLHRN